MQKICDICKFIQKQAVLIVQLYIKNPASYHMKRDLLFLKCRHKYRPDEDYKKTSRSDELNHYAIKLLGLEYSA